MTVFMAYCLLATVLGIALQFLVVAGANGPYVLELVQVVHSGGVAPPPANVPSREKICSPKNSGTCAAIANRGGEQVRAMGNYILGEYKKDTAITGSNTWFEQQYNPAIVYTRSAADVHTTQAAKALLQGIYGLSMSLVTPTIVTTALDRDSLLNVDAYQSLIVTNKVNGDALNKTLEAVVDEQFPDFAVLRAMGAEVGLDAICSLPADRVLCCRELQQLATMYAATGAADEAPSVTANKAKLDAVAAAHFHELYSYNASVPLKLARGSLGQPLAQELLRNMRRKMISKEDADYNAMRVMQYAHRVPIGTTLGHMPPDETPLVETFLVDLLRDSATNAFFVRLRYATAGADGGGAGFADFPFRCLDAKGTPTGEKTTGGVICPFDDFRRFVESSEGRGRRGGGAACYLDEDTRAKFDCEVEGRPPSSACADYRAACPSQACADGQTYDAANATCLLPMDDMVIITNGVIIGVSIASALVAIMFGVLCFEMFPFFFRCQTKKTVVKEAGE